MVFHERWVASGDRLHTLYCQDCHVYVTILSENHFNKTVKTNTNRFDISLVFFFNQTLELGKSLLGTSALANFEYIKSNSLAQGSALSNCNDVSNGHVSVIKVTEIYALLNETGSFR